MQQLEISSIDLAVIGLYFAVVFAIGFYFARRTHDSTDLFLAGRRLGWIPIGLSLFASNISSTTLIGLAGAAYTWGIAVANYEWMAAPILVVFAIFLMPLYLQGRIGTVPEYLELRFDARVRRYFSALTLVSNIVVDTAGTLFAGALVLTGFIPSLDMFTAALLLAAIAAAYTAAGGLAAVVYTDVLQAIILLVGASLVAFLAFAAIDFAQGQAKLVRPSQEVLAKQVDLTCCTAQQRPAIQEAMFQDLLCMETVAVDRTNAILQEQREFVDSVRLGKPVRVTGEQGRDALAVAEQILAAIQSHRWNGLPPDQVGPHANFASAMLPTKRAA